MIKKVSFFLLFLGVSSLQFFLTVIGWGTCLVCIREHASGIWGTFFSWGLWEQFGAMLGIFFILFPFYSKLAPLQRLHEKEQAHNAHP